MESLPIFQVFLISMKRKSIFDGTKLLVEIGQNFFSLGHRRRSGLIQKYWTWLKMQVRDKHSYDILPCHQGRMNKAL
jgi:hypothetical protein